MTTYTPPISAGDDSFPPDPPANVLRFEQPYSEDRFKAQRRVMIFGPLTDALTEAAAGQLLSLANMTGEPIDIYINSQGGPLANASALHDVIKAVSVSVPIQVIGMGQVEGTALLVMLTVDKQARVSLPNTRYCLRASDDDLAGHAGRNTGLLHAGLQSFCGFIAEATERRLEEITSDVENGLLLDASEALAYGLVGAAREASSA